MISGMNYIYRYFNTGSTFEDHNESFYYILGDDCDKNMQVLKCHIIISKVALIGYGIFAVL